MGWGRLVYFGQWVPTVLMPVWWMLTTGALNRGGSGLGILVLTALVFPLSLIPVMMSVMWPASRSARRVAGRYAVVSVGLWLDSIAIPIVIRPAPESVTGVLLLLWAVLFVAAILTSVRLPRVSRTGL